LGINKYYGSNKEYKKNLHQSSTINIILSMKSKSVNFHAIRLQTAAACGLNRILIPAKIQLNMTDIRENDDE
jgi:hypothetical protein